MNSLDYYGHSILDYMAERYVAEHFKTGDGYSVLDHDGLPLCGLVVEGKATHRLQVKTCAHS